MPIATFNALACPTKESTNCRKTFSWIRKPSATRNLAGVAELRARQPFGSPVTTSASSNTMAGARAASSMVTRFMWSPRGRRVALPTAVEPVNDIFF